MNNGSNNSFWDRLNPFRHIRNNTDNELPSANIQATQEKAVSNTAETENNAIPKNNNVIPPKKTTYYPPSICLLRPDFFSPEKKADLSELRDIAYKIEEIFNAFGISVLIVSIQQGVSWTRFELAPKTGVKINSILYHKKDLQLRLGVKTLEIEAPIPGKNTIGIDIPNRDKSYLHLYGLVDSKEFKRANEAACIIGKERFGESLICDFSDTQHILITGNDYREVAIMRDSLLCSILFKATPKSIRMIMIDTKVTEMRVFNGIPHLEMPVINDDRAVPEVLKWVNTESQRRLSLFAGNSVKTLREYNYKCGLKSEDVLPHIILIINTPDDWDYETVEKDHLLSSMIYKSAIVGIHIIACCRTNCRNRIFQILNERITTKIVFMIPSQETSKEVINYTGAETLDGNGEFYFLKTGLSKPLRGICAKVEESEISLVIGDLKMNYAPSYSVSEISVNTPNNTKDSDLFDQAVEAVLDNGSASVSVLQRRLDIGYPRAARLIDELEKKHIIGPFEGSKPRKILLTKTEWHEIKQNQIK